MAKPIRRNTPAAEPASETNVTGGRGRKREWSDDPAANFKLAIEGFMRPNLNKDGTRKVSRTTGLPQPEEVKVLGVVDKATALAAEITRIATNRNLFEYEQETAEALSEYILGIFTPALEALVERPKVRQSARGFRLDSLTR